MTELFASPLKIINEPNNKYYPIFYREKNASLVTKVTKSAESTKRKQSPNSVSKREGKRVRRRLHLVNYSEQYALDFGQKHFDAEMCEKCRMLYTTGDVSDEKTHQRYHDLFVNSLKFNGWKHEDMLSYDDYGRIIRVLPNYPKYMHKKVNDLFSVADLELGIRVDIQESMNSSSVYLIFVTKDKRIAGFVAAERIKIANRLSSSEPFVASTEEEDADCGVSRLWVHPNYRRKKIATRLLDTLRENFIAGKSILRSKIAFSDPTLNGNGFAKFYTGSCNFLIYQYQNDDF